MTPISEVGNVLQAFIGDFSPSQGSTWSGDELKATCYVGSVKVCFDDEENKY